MFIFSLTVGYLTDNGHDNFFITPQFKKSEKEREEKKKDTVLPIKVSEKDLYTDSTSPKPTKVERTTFLINLVPWVIFLMLSILAGLGDYALWATLAIMQKYGEVKADITGNLAFEVKGKGKKVFFKHLY